MGEEKLMILIIMVLLLGIHIFFMFATGVYQEEEFTGTKICDYCVHDGRNYPCNCEEEKIYHKSPVILIIPSILIFLVVLNFLIKENG